MEFSTFEEWRASLMPFLSRWEERMNTVLRQDNVIEFFLNNFWGDFELEFDQNIKGNLPQAIRPVLSKGEGRKVVTHMVALLDHKKNLDSALDGEASLAPREYFLSIVEHFSSMREILERLVVDEPTQNISIDEIMPTEEPQPVGEDMVEQVVDIGEHGEKIMESRYDSLSMNTARKNNPLPAEDRGRGSGAVVLPRAKRRQSKNDPAYDSGLHRIDPVVSGPIVSLAGKKKREADRANTKNSQVTGQVQAVSSEMPLDSKLLTAFRSAISRVGSGGGDPGERELLENLALQFFTHNPQNPDNIVQEIKDLDNRLAIIGGEEGDFKVEAVMVTDRLSNLLHREVEAITAMASPTFLKVLLSGIEEKDSHEGEYRSFALEFSTRKRVIGFHKGELRFTLLYYPRVVRLTVKATGVPRLAPPFFEGEATILIDYNEKSDTVLTGFALRALSAFIAQVIS